ncbi:hypothetical protein CRG98_029932 [Punica granatum]|uniref:RNase H type-1 domain-containing protein n=1 Tax=Punica granatum TaxID=22663 RepID=A0A2I0J0A4_PUNGR|nr:hypothetical protein CRG98_029932 [Punica granatum]
METVAAKVGLEAKIPGPAAKPTVEAAVTATKDIPTMFSSWIIVQGKSSKLRNFPKNKGIGIVKAATNRGNQYNYGTKFDILANKEDSSDLPEELLLGEREMARQKEKSTHRIGWESDNMEGFPFQFKGGAFELGQISKQSRGQRKFQAKPNDRELSDPKGTRSPCFKRVLRDYLREVKPNVGFFGGIWLWWNPQEVSISHVSRFSQAMHFSAVWEGRWLPWITAVYGHPTKSVRRELLTDLKRISTEINEEWLVIGDFNEITDTMEKIGGAPTNPMACLKFREVLEFCSLLDLGSNGPRLTWKGPVVGGYDHVYKQLDRAVSNASWRTLYSEAMGSNYFLKNLELKVKRELDEVLAKEELLWFQKSRSEWVQQGDRNTRYFHSKAIIKRKVLRTEGLQMEDKTWCFDDDVLRKMVLDHFQQFYKKPVSHARPRLGFSFLHVESHHTDSLGREISVEEVHQAISEMYPFKAPGSDGFHAYFYQSNWELVERQVTELVREIIEGRKSASVINNTLIVLIPKELMHTMCSLRRKKGFMAINVDLEKAYDSLSWDFIDDTLRVVGIPNNLRQVKMDCITTPSLQVMWNGDKIKKFTMERASGQKVSAAKTIVYFSRNVSQATCQDIQAISSLLRIRRLRKFNEAFLAKICWDLAMNSGTLWAQTLRHKYVHANAIIPRFNAKSGVSRLWNSLCVVWPKISLGIKWSIGSGDTIALWQDSWVPYHGSLIDVAARMVPNEWRGALVHDFADVSTGWRWDLFSYSIPQQTLLHITALPPPLPDRGPDRPFWKLTSNVAFSDWQNKSIFEPQFVRPLNSAAMIFKVVHGFVQSDLCANAYTDRKARDWKLIGWRMPSDGWLKLNTDGAAKGNPSLARAGGLLRDDNGRWLGGFVHNIKIATSILVELWTVKNGFEVSREIGPRRLVLETDSELVANLLRS